MMNPVIVALASDAEHRFSKPPRESLVMLSGRGVQGDAHAGVLVQHLSLGGEEIELQRHALNAGDFLGQRALLGGFVGVGPPAADFEFVFAGSGGAPASFLEKLGHGGFSSGYLCRRKGPRGGRFPGCRAFGWDDPLWGEWDDPLWD